MPPENRFSSLAWKRVVGGLALVLVHALQVASSTGDRAGGPGPARARSPASARRQPGVGLGHAVQRRSAPAGTRRRACCPARGAAGRARSAAVVGGQARALAAHVGQAHGEALGDLPVHGQVPLLRARPLVGVQGTVVRSLAVAVVGLDEGRRREVLGEAVLQEEGRLEPAQGAVEGDVAGEAVLADPAAPAGVEGAVVEDAPARADEGLVVERVGQAQAGGEGLLVGLLRIVGAVAGRPLLGPREGQTARAVLRPRGWRPSGSKKESRSYFSREGLK